jgi:hypothetical protein
VSTVALPASPGELDAVYAKIAKRIIPFLALLFAMAWLDRYNIGFAKLQGNSANGRRKPSPLATFFDNLFGMKRRRSPRWYGPNARARLSICLRSARALRNKSKPLCGIVAAVCFRKRCDEPPPREIRWVADAIE